MQRSLKRLERVLKLESDQGYKNKAVVGGIRQFAMYWVAQAREEAANEIDRAFVEQTAELLQDYGRLPGSEARGKVITSLLERLHEQQSRLALEPARETAPSPRQTPAQAAKPKPATKSVTKPASGRPQKERPPRRRPPGLRQPRS